MSGLILLVYLAYWAVLAIVWLGYASVVLPLAALAGFVAAAAMLPGSYLLVLIQVRRGPGTCSSARRERPRTFAGTAHAEVRETARMAADAMHQRRGRCITMIAGTFKIRQHLSDPAFSAPFGIGVAIGVLVGALVGLAALGIVLCLHALLAGLSHLLIRVVGFSRTPSTDTARPKPRLPDEGDVAADTGEEAARIGGVPTDSKGFRPVGDLPYGGHHGNASMAAPGYPQEEYPLGHRWISDGHGTRLSLATPGERRVARVIDMAIVFGAALAIDIPIVARMSGNGGNALPILLIGSLVGGYFCYEWLVLALWSRSIGKWIVGLRVLKQPPQLSRLTIIQAFERALCYPFLYALLAAVGRGRWDVPANETGQAAHDEVAGTVVVNEHPARWRPPGQA